MRTVKQVVIVSFKVSFHCKLLLSRRSRRGDVRTLLLQHSWGLAPLANLAMLLMQAHMQVHEIGCMPHGGGDSEKWQQTARWYISWHSVINIVSENQLASMLL